MKNNSIGQDLKNKTVIIKKGAFNPAFAHFEGMPFKVTDGFGCSPTALGSALFGMFANGVEDRISRNVVAAIVEDIPQLDRMVELHKEASAEVHSTMVPGKAYPLGELTQRTQKAFEAKLIAEGIIVDGKIEVPIAVPLKTPRKKAKAVV